MVESVCAFQGLIVLLSIYPLYGIFHFTPSLSCRDINLGVPYDVNEQPRQLHYTYLDTVGRPVVIATSTNLVEQHIQDFQLTYTFDKIMLLQEPLLLVGALYLFFLLVVIIVRLDFSITKVHVCSY